MDLVRSMKEAEALKAVAKAAVPKTDPVLGAEGSLVRLWGR